MTPEPSRPLQFRLWHLLLATTLIAALLGIYVQGGFIVRSLLLIAALLSVGPFLCWLGIRTKHVLIELVGAVLILGGPVLAIIAFALSMLQFLWF